MASQSEPKTSSAQPDTVACIIAPPISSSVVSSPVTFSATRGEARYIEALPSTMPTQSVKAGMYAPPAADGPSRQQICGTRPDRATCSWKIREAPRRSEKKPSWSVRRPPAESTR